MKLPASLYDEFNRYRRQPRYQPDGFVRLLRLLIRDKEIDSDR